MITVSGGFSWHRDGGSLSRHRVPFAPPHLGRLTMQWYCLHTKSCGELAAETYCRTQLTLETYYPRLKQRKTIRRVKRWVVRPLFPRYIFCRFDLEQHFRAVRYAPEVVSVVAFGDKPTVVEDVVIETLKRWATEVVDIVTLQSVPKPGEVVEISDGPFAGLRAVVERVLDDQERVAVLLSSLALQARLVVSREQITAI